MAQNNKSESNKSPKRPRGEQTAPSHGVTNATRVYSRLREDILSGKLAPGEKLQFDITREIYATGLSPLREALTRLAADGLVVLQDQRGFSVTPMSREDFLDITRIRIVIEGLATKLALEIGDDEWEANLLASYHRLKRATEQRAAGEPTAFITFEERHREFHEMLASGCNSPQILAIRTRLFNLGDRYRRRMSGGNPPSTEAILQEHRDLLEMALARNPEIVEVMKGHIERTTTAILRQFDATSGELGGEQRALESAA